jgi:hypothetical protein
VGAGAGWQVGFGAGWQETGAGAQEERNRLNRLVSRQKVPPETFWTSWEDSSRIAIL